MKTFHVLAATVPAWLCAAAFAQKPPDTSQLTPLNYRSVFTGYQTFNDQPVAPWRATNDTVEQKGGWKAYAKEAAQSDAPPNTTPASAPGSSTPPNPHDSHGAKP